MASKEILELVDKSNEGILNAIRADASMDYQQRIPEATKANLQAVLENLRDNRPGYNEFVDALVNRIGLTLGRNMIWSNPLSRFKIGMLTYGDSIEEYAVGLLQSHTYEDDREAGEKAIFGTEIPEVKANIHKRNRKEYYKISINENALNAAFLTPGGISDFVTKLMQTPTTSDQWDEFLLMTQLFAEYERNGGFYKIHVEDVSGLTSDKDAVQDAIRKTRALAGNLLFPSTRYNAARMPTFANPDELILFATPEYQAAVDVEALAGAFNPDKLSTPAIVTIPKERFNIPGVQAILTTKDFFVVADTLIQTEQARNPVKMMTNYFLHHQGVISASTFVPAVAFWTGESTEVIEIETPVVSVTPVTVTNRDDETVVEVQRGEIYNVLADAVTSPADGPNDGVRFTLSGATAPRTKVTNLGVLHVGGTEGANSLTITATATWIDPNGLTRDGIKASTTVSVVGAKASDWPVLESAETAVAALSARAVMPEPTPYDSLTKAELAEMLSERGLPTTGTNAEQAARLVEDDATRVVTE